MFITTPLLLAGKKGSKYSKPRSTSPERLAVQLTDFQKDAVVGTMLGDSCMERAKSTHNARLRFDQTFPNHASYLTYLYVLFINLCSKCPRVNTRKADSRTGNVYSTISVKTNAFPCFNYYHNLFYSEGVKVVPANIAVLLTARALAFWIMDDGGKGSYGVTILHTNSFTLTDVKLLQSALLSNFQLRTRLIQRTPGKWAIVIPVRQTVSLREIVAPYMHVSMLNKI